MLCVHLMDFTDRLTVDAAATRITRDGYLATTVKAARTGVQQYRGSEVDPQNEHGMRDQAVVNAYRPPEEVFSSDALASFAHRPVTVDHPPEAVTSKNWRDFSVGQTGGEIRKDDNFVYVPLVLMDQAAIDAVSAGKREISQGYTCDLDWTEGTTQDGLAFQVVQRNIRANHTAIVGLARGGPELRIGDSAMTKIMMVDGHSVELSDAAAVAVANLQAKFDAADAAIKGHATAAAQWATDKATLDAQVATLTKDLADAKASIPTGDALDKLAADRADLIADAKLIGGDGLDITGDSASIKKRAVLAVFGDSYKDRDAAFFDAAFTIQRDQAKAKGGGTQAADALRQSFALPANTGVQVMPSAATLADGQRKAEEARAKMIADMTSPEPATKAA
jgi:uncharacterized protein